jgi:hypothetical protein
MPSLSLAESIITFLTGRLRSATFTLLVQLVKKSLYFSGDRSTSPTAIGKPTQYLAGPAA